MSLQILPGFAPLLNETSALPISDFSVTSSPKNTSTSGESCRKVPVPLENFWESGISPFPLNSTPLSINQSLFHNIRSIQHHYTYWAQTYCEHRTILLTELKEHTFKLHSLTSGKSFFSCSMFPMRGKGNGPGGSFPVSDNFLHTEQTRRQDNANQQEKDCGSQGFHCNVEQGGGIIKGWSCILEGSL